MVAEEGEGEEDMIITINGFNVIVVKEEDGGYSGRCIEYPGAISQGETLEELECNMRDAISLIQQSYEKAGE